MTVPGSRPFKEVIKVKPGHLGGPDPIGLVSLKEEGIRAQTCPEEDRVRTQDETATYTLSRGPEDPALLTT